MKGRFCSAGLILGILLSLSAPASAHLLKVFVYAEGDQLLGSTYFSGGALASGARIRIFNAEERLIATLQPDTQGEFQYRVAASGDYVVVADTGDGHRAEWRVGADELASDLPPLSSDGVAVNTGQVVALAAADAKAQPAVAPEQLAALVERAVARQVGPLRKELQGYGDRVRLGDLLGGIGFIFGLAGLTLWWRSRR